MKFGGSSLADHTRVDHVAKLIRSQIEEEGADPIIVHSAMGKSTNLLLAAADAALEGGAAEEAVAPVAALARECAALDLPADVLAAVDELVAELTGSARRRPSRSPPRCAAASSRSASASRCASSRRACARSAARPRAIRGRSDSVTSSEFGNAGTTRRRPARSRRPRARRRLGGSAGAACPS